MSDIASRFKGCAAAEVKAGRVPNPELGKAAYLIDTVRMKDGRNGGFRTEVNMTCLYGIQAGTTSEGKEAGPNHAGDKVNQCIFSGDYFHKQFKEFCLKAIGKEPHEELEIADYVCPTADYPGKPELDRLQIMWEEVLPGMVCAFDPKDGSATEAGVFDGQVVLEIGTTEKDVPTLIDKSKGVVDGNFMFDANGNKISKVYRNSYFNRKIGKAEIREKLDEKDLARFFGSVEAFEALED